MPWTPNNLDLEECALVSDQRPNLVNIWSCLYCLSVFSIIPKMRFGVSHGHTRTYRIKKAASIGCTWGMEKHGMLPDLAS